MEALLDLPIMHKMEILLKTENCAKHNVCAVVEKCPGRAVFKDSFPYPELAEDKCLKCGRCVNTCSNGVFNKV